MKIYIAGPMSGLPDFNRTAFQMAHLNLKNDGHTVLSPAVLPDGLEQHEYMDICLAMLRCADCIYMLKGWEDSLGAKAEHALADKLGLQIEYQRTHAAYAADKRDDLISTPQHVIDEKWKQYFGKKQAGE